MPTQTVISINRQTPIMGPATFYPRVVVERLLSIIKMLKWNAVIQRKQQRSGNSGSGDYEKRKFENKLVIANV